MDEVDESFGFGFRGSLLARLAVAALHMSNEGAATCEIAARAIEIRKTEYKSSMLPMESSAIILIKIFCQSCSFKQAYTFIGELRVRQYVNKVKFRQSLPKG